MIDFGGTLVKAREAKGLSITQISEMTHMMPQQIEDLENENFSKIPAPIYGRGFVKLYCEAVGIDPKPLVAEFMDIFNGNRQPMIRMRKSVQKEAAEPIAPPAAEAPGVEPTPPPPQPAAPEENLLERAAEPPQQVAEQESSAPESQEEETSEPEPQEEKLNSSRESLDLFERQIENDILEHEDDEPTGIRHASETPAFTFGDKSEKQPEAPAFRLEQESVKAYEPYEPEPERETTPRISRYAPPTPKDDEFHFEDKFPFSIPPAAVRIAILVGGALLALWLICALVSKAWRAATDTSQDDSAVLEENSTYEPIAQTPQNQENNDNSSSELKFGPKTSRTPIEVPPLYIY